MNIKREGFDMMTKVQDWAAEQMLLTRTGNRGEEELGVGEDHKSILSKRTLKFLMGQLDKDQG